MKDGVQWLRARQFACPINKAEEQVFDRMGSGEKMGNLAEKLQEIAKPAVRYLAWQLGLI
jgi:hypothetical protein